MKRHSSSRIEWPLAARNRRLSVWNMVPRNDPSWPEFGHSTLNRNCANYRFGGMGEQEEKSPACQATGEYRIA
jgi:hypothetical protein